MTTYTKFDKANLKTLRKELDVVLKAFADEHGLEIEQGNGRFEPGKFDLKVEIKIPGVEIVEDRVLNMMIETYNLVKENKFGEKLVEYKSRNNKYPFIYEKGGKRYKAPLEHVKIKFAA